MLKHGILGLLNYGDMTGYEIMGVFQDSLKYFWTVQTSQIYRELQTLKKNGWVTDVLVPQTGKPDKNVFSITDIGKEELHRWLLEDDIGLEKKVPFLMKTFFRGELTPEENIAFFQKMQEYCQYSLDGLKEPEKNLEFYETAIQNSTKALYWKMTIEYGVMYMNMLREWSSKCIEELEDLKNENFDN